MKSILRSCDGSRFQGHLIAHYVAHFAEVGPGSIKFAVKFAVKLTGNKELGQGLVHLFVAGIWLASAGSLLAAVHYVDLNSVSPKAPYTNWASAAAIIQDAVDASAAGDEIVVTNGMYATGGRALDGMMTNRVAVDKALTLRSANGPHFTIIQGYKLPGTNNGDGAIRCVYLANGAILSGFTLTNGATRAVFENAPNRKSSGGGVWCEYRDSVVVTNCVIAGNAAANYGAGAAQGTLNNCTLTGNLGPGVYYSALNNCTLAANSGGGASSSTLNYCTLSGNTGSGASSSSLTNFTASGNSNDGADSCTLDQCVLTGNSGVGASSSTLRNCTVTGNSGGGTLSSTLNNCAVTGNSIFGAEGSTLNHCTLTSNSGGGAYSSSLTNCIVYFNTAHQGANYDASSTLNYCCTTPLTTNGVANIASDPQLASAAHLSADSPCRGAGLASSTSGTDIDGEAWASPPSIGCDEYHAGAVTGVLSVAITPSFTNALPDYTLEFTALIEGPTTGSVWDFGDGSTATNQPYTSHAWAAPGNYQVVLRAFNDSQPGGVRATVTIHVVAQALYYVAADNINPVAPYTSWATAATNIQDAVDAASVVGAVVVVTNGIYAAGGWDGNRVLVDKPLSLQSVNGADFTIIDGRGSVRCVSLASRSSLSGFTLTNGVALEGAGAWCESTDVVISNCVLSGNSGPDSGNGYSPAGGGAYGGLTNVAAGFTVDFRALIEGRTASSVWDFGDGIEVTNQTTTSHAWATPGNYAVVFRVYNESLPGGISATVVVNVAPGVHYVAAGSSNPVRPYMSWATAAGNIQDAVDVATVPGAVVLVTNGVYATGPRVAAGASNRVVIDKLITVRSVNGPQFTRIDGGQVARCVYLTNRASLSGFTLTNGATRGLSDGYYFRGLSDGGGAFCESLAEVVTNCVLTGNSAYPGAGGGASGGTLNNCALIGNTAQWKGGGADLCTLNHCTLAGNVTHQDGGGASSCMLNDCTVTGNQSPGDGGGALQSTLDNCTLNGNSALGGGGAGYSLLNNCLLSGNSASGGKGAASCTLNNCTLTANSAERGGGAIGTLNNCILTGNMASVSGGGADSSVLNNCTLIGNSAVISGGGASWSTANNCIVYFNTAPEGANYDLYTGVINYCCTTPQPTTGLGNITNAPLFMDQSSGDLRLQSNSPCINSGSNAYAPADLDLDGNARIVGGTVDIGAYEFQSPTSMISYAWLQQYHLPTNGSADTADSDGDGLNNWQEWRCGTNPTDALSTLRLLSVAIEGGSVTVTWQSVAGVAYFLERSADLGGTAPFTPLATNLAGKPGTTTYIDTSAVGSGPYFYRVGIGN